MDIDWLTVFPGIPFDKLSCGVDHFQKTVVYSGESKWKKEGTLYCSGFGMSRVGFAIRKGVCSWHFRDRGAIELYRGMNGACTTSEVTIKFKFDDRPDYETIGKIIKIVLENGQFN